MPDAVQLTDNFETCATGCIHRDVIRAVQRQMPDSADLADLADFYKLFADNTRLRILAALSRSELCVCDLGVLLKMKQPAVSHQLRTLKQARIVTSRRDGKVVYYSLCDDHIRKVLNVGLEHLCER